MFYPNYPTFGLDFFLPVSALSHLPFGFRFPIIKFIVIDFKANYVFSVNIFATEDQDLISNGNWSRTVPMSFESAHLKVDLTEKRAFAWNDFLK